MKNKLLYWLLSAVLLTASVFGQVRLKDKPTASSPAGDDWLYLDGATNGVRKIAPSFFSGSGGAKLVTRVISASNTPVTTGSDSICDGTADEVEIQAAINAVSTAGGGIVHLREGNYNLSDSIICKDNVWLRGEGWKTVLLPSWTNQNKSAIDWTRSGKSAASPHVNMWFTDFKIDCTNASNVSYTTNCKGIFIQFLRRCKFERLWVHNSFATGIGVDFLVESEINGCIVTDFGRGMSPAGSGVGGNGIGIGTGESTEESLVISECHIYQSLNAGNNGIMFEDQDATAGVIARYMHVVNSTMRGCYVGARISGVESVTYSACSIFNSITDGIVFSAGITGSSQLPKEVVITGSQIAGNGGWGIKTNSSNLITALTIQGNQINRNTSGGIAVSAVEDLSIIANQVRFNGGPGIAHTAGTMNGALIKGNRVQGNGTDGITFTTAANNVQIIGNHILSQQNYGLRFNAAISNVLVASNFIYNNGQAGTLNDGIRVDSTLTKALFTGNKVFDSQGTKTQRYGWASGSSTMSDITVRGNDFRDNLTGAAVISGTPTNVRFAQNDGYNPVGVSSISVGASPYTYTAGRSPVNVHVFGGTVSNVSKGATQIASASGLVVHLEPGEALTITYSAAPTMIADIE